MDLLSWLNENSGAVTAVAAVAGVVVATAYSIFAALQWRATKAQADITRRTFEASHRPYLTVEAQEPTDTGTHGLLSFALAFLNHGSVPADITAFEVAGTLMDLDGPEQPVNRVEPIQTPVSRSLAPRELAMIELEFVADATDFDAQRAGESWKTQGRRMR